MITLRKRRDGGKSYLVRVSPFAARTVYTRQAATKLETALKNRAALGEILEAAPSSLGAELAAFVERKHTRKTLRDRTVEFDERTAKALAPLAPLLVSHLSRRLVEDHMIERAADAPVAANNELGLLKACLREAVSRGHRVDPGIFEIPAVAHKPRRGKALEVAELYELASWFPEHVRRLILVAGQVGARQHFWFALTDEMLDLDAGTMEAPAELQKNARDHRVYLTPVEVALLREQLLARAPGTRLVFPTVTGRQWTRHHFRKRVWAGAVAGAAAKDREQSGRATSVFEGFTFHLLRHTAGSLMALAGTDPSAASERLGQSDGGVLFLKTYRHLYERERRAHAERFGAFVAAELAQREDKAAVSGS